MINIGILGCGGIVPFHIKAALRHPDANVVHIADERLEVAQKLANKYKIKQVSNNLSEVLANDNVNVVIIALPTFLHHEWIIRCAKARKHIITEKPLCRTVSQGKEVIRACVKYGVKIIVGYQRRFSPSRIKVRELIQSGMLGRPVTWTISSFGPRLDYYRGPNNWMWDVNKGGGFIMDGSIHDFDFACWILGKPVKMFAQSRRISTAVTVPTQAAAYIHFEHGDNLVYGMSWQEGNFGSTKLPDSIVGPKGTIVLNSDFSFTWFYSSGKKRKFIWNPNKFYPKRMGIAWLFNKQLDSFIKDNKTNSCLVNGEEALNSLWISENIITSGPNGRIIKWRL
jgi:predicted dehydrogenase